MLMLILPILTLALFCIISLICRGFSTVVEIVSRISYLVFRNNEKLKVSLRF